MGDENDPIDDVVERCVHPMSDLELGWLAGLLEGEGCFRFRMDSRGRRGNPDIQINMTDEDVLRRAHSVSGLGTFHGPFRQPGNRKPFWVWKVSLAADAVALMTVLRPLMGARRQEQIDDALRRYVEQPRGKTGRGPHPATWRSAA